MFGATVTVEDIDTGEASTYTILGAEEADTKKGRISIESPLGRALLGKTTGDEVSFVAPKGRRTVEITALRFGV
jgi:transcription elongation factor GreA